MLQGSMPKAGAAPSYVVKIHTSQNHQVQNAMTKLSAKDTRTKRSAKSAISVWLSFVCQPLLHLRHWSTRCNSLIFGISQSEASSFLWGDLSYYRPFLTTLEISAFLTVHGVVYVYLDNQCWGQLFFLENQGCVGYDRNLRIQWWAQPNTVVLSALFSWKTAASCRRPSSWTAAIPSQDSTPSSCACIFGGNEKNGTRTKCRKYIYINSLPQTSFLRNAFYIQSLSSYNLLCA